MAISKTKLVKAIKDLFEFEDYEATAAQIEEVAEKATDQGWTIDSVMIEVPGQGKYGPEYLITVDGFALAVERVKQDLEHEPEIFSQDWLRDHLKMRPGDIRIFAQERADSYVEDIDDERVIEEAYLEGDWETLDEEYDDAEERIARNELEHDRLDDTTSDIDVGTKEWADVEKKMDALVEEDVRLQARQTEIDKEKEDLVYQGRETLKESLSTDYEREMKTDPIGYFEEYGYTVKDLLDKSWLVIDEDKAAKDAVMIDGAAHFLSSYDGTEHDLEGGLDAYRTN